MRKSWILAADSSRARIFEKEGPRGEMREVEAFANPEGRAQGRELHSDAQGRSYGIKGESHQGHSAMEAPDPAEHETEMFSKMLGDYLDKARAQNRYVELCLIAPPKFLGKLRANLGRETQKLVGKEIPKHLSRLDAKDIEAYVEAD